jgi:hypothetical protein
MRLLELFAVHILLYNSQVESFEQEIGEGRGTAIMVNRHSREHIGDNSFMKKRKKLWLTL